MLAAAPASADTKSFSTQGCSTWTVPVGVSSVTIDAIGARGANGSGSTSSTGQGGLPDEVKGTVSVSHGQAVYVCVAVGSGSGSSGGGNGGGASGASLGQDFSDPVVIGAGGGGGGAAESVSGGNGGAAGSNGGAAAGGSGASGGKINQGSPSTASGPGTGGTATGSGGGGGGAGYTGGGGGSGSSLGGGGGAGGTDYCNAGSCNTAAATSSAPQVVLSYTVASAPSTSIGAPANGAWYELNSSVSSSFSCAEGAGGSGISSCTDQNGRGSGTPLDTSSTGSHTITVTATSSDGLSSSSQASYNVAARPVVWLPLPPDGATYTQGQAVDSWFACRDGQGGPGLASCVDQQGRGIGAAIDTSTLGTHTFTVTATSEDGLTRSATSTYTVVPPPTVSNIRAHRGGLVTLDVTVYGPGVVATLESAGFKSFAVRRAADRIMRAADAIRADADALKPALGSFIFGRNVTFTTGAATLHLKVALTPAGKLLLRYHRTAGIRLWVVFSDDFSTTQIISDTSLRISR